MRVDKDYPAPQDLKKIELDTLDRLRSNPTIRRKFPSLSIAANQYYQQLKGKLDQADFSFEVCLEYSTPKGRSRAKGEWNFYFGVNIISNIGKGAGSKSAKSIQHVHNFVTYSLSICNMIKKPPYLVRKFHFDYVKNGNEKSHPIFHLQYPGEMTPALRDAGYSNKHMDSDLSEPRIHYQPVTLALLLNLVFKEFYTEDTHSLLEDDTWKGLIYKNEKAVLKPYFEQCFNFLKSHNHSPSKLFTKDFNYGQ